LIIRNTASKEAVVAHVGAGFGVVGWSPAAARTQLPAVCCTLGWASLRDLRRLPLKGRIQVLGVWMVRGTELVGGAVKLTAPATLGSKYCVSDATCRPRGCS